MSGVKNRIDRDLRNNSGIIKLPFVDARALIRNVSQFWIPPEHLRISEMEYAEKFVKIRNEQDLLIGFTKNPVQNLLEQAKRNAPLARAQGQRYLILKARRMGITTYEQVRSYALCRTRRNTKCLTLAHKREDTETIFEMVKLMHKEDPNPARLEKNRVDALAYKDMGTSFSIGTAGGVAVKRGAGLSRSHGSEVAFWPGSDSEVDNLVVAINEATRTGEVVFESTANGLSGWFYETWMQATSGSSIWNPIFFPWFADPRNQFNIDQKEAHEIIETLTDEEASLVERFDIKLTQLAWRREKRKGNEAWQKRFKQEYPATPEEAFISSVTSYFGLDTIELLMRRCKPPIRESEGLCIWMEPEESQRYIVAADTSEGSDGSDPSPIVVLNWATGEQVYRLNWSVRPNVLGNKCVEIAKHYNGALIAVENNNTGHSALNTIMNQCCYSNVYYPEDAVRDEPKESLTPGWRTTGLTRPILLNDLNDALEKGYMKVNDKLFLSQCRVFRDNGSGKSEASRKSGHHGDLVFAYGIAWQARKSKWMLDTKPIFV